VSEVKRVHGPATRRQATAAAVPGLDGHGRGWTRVQPPLSVYIHFPWCIRKCPYCDFNSHALGTGSGPDEAAYVAALRAELESMLPQVWGRRVETVFMGGGTPSLFSGEAIAQVLSDLRARLPMAPGCEVTLEANPGTFEAARFAAFRAAGVTRLSLGVQSFDDARLHALGRVHDGAQARAAARCALQTFDAVNLDLMIGLPGQDSAGLDRDLDEALALAPPHLSVYQLTLEPNTVFHKYPPVLPDEDTLEDISGRALQRLAQAGYGQYEVSAHARPGQACRHNLNYWTFGDYLGLGAGAHGKITGPDGIVRTANHRQPEAYMQAAREGRAACETRVVGEGEAGFEFMLNALRLREGFSPELFEAHTGFPFALLEPGLARAGSRGLIERHGPVWRPTALGWRFLNDLQSEFLPPNPA
jgi:oxygen-independent coproporphyrinogen-3 oxidase